MPDKLTDNEIVKALECCSKPVGENCKECPLHLTDCLKVNIEELALDLINRQKAENERLTTALKEISNGLAEVKVLVARDLKNAKAEAYKEFAEELHNKAMKPEEICDNFAVGCNTIDNLLKELVGETK